MWIRRSFGNDTLYTTLVQAYMDTLLQNGFNIECFIGESAILQLPSWRGSSNYTFLTDQVQRVAAHGLESSLLLSLGFSAFC